MEGKPNDGILESADGSDMVQQAMIYATGELEAECDDEAFQQCRLVGERGGAEVLYFLGVCHYFGWGTVKDLKAAVQCYVKAAELGSFEALERFKEMRNDQSVQTNLQNAFRSFCEKADQGDARAQFNAGFCHYWGIITPEDRAKARDLFQMAADQGCTDAMWMLDVCRRVGVGDGYNGMQEIELLKYAAEMGSAEAQFELGCAYYYGETTTYGLEVEQDYKQMIEWYQKAADQNNTIATNNLAYRYYNGEGVNKDLKKAFQLWKKAALMGDEWSQDRISKFYRHKMFSLSKDEQPVDIDYFEAIYWSRKAVDQDSDYAKKNMPDVLNVMGLQQNQIDKLMKQASAFEAAITWYNIAKQYETGEGVEKDEQKAFQIYRLSARLGSIPAKTVLGRYYEVGVGTNVDMDQAAHWYEKATIQGDHEAAEHLLDLIQPESVVMALKEGSPFAALAECYETGNGVPRNEDTTLLMKEHAAASGDIEQAKIVIDAYISGNGNEYRIRDVGSIISKTPGLSSKDYQQFIELFNDNIDELDKAQILQNAANSIRTETLGIHIIFD